MYQQSADYALERARCGLPVVFQEIPDANHFSILEGTEHADGCLLVIVRGTVAAAGL
jgi:arylformamidase